MVGSNFTELWISLDPAVDYEATVARVQEVVDGYPGLYRDLLTYLRERIKEVLTPAQYDSWKKQCMAMATPAKPMEKK